MYNCTYYYANDCTPKPLIMYIVHNHIFSERRYHNIFSLRFLVLVFLHQDYVTENATANI